jgi:hypothetical protein
MDWQLLTVGVFVLLALAYLGRQTLRTWRGQRAGCGGCKCPGAAKTSNSSATAQTLIPVEQVTLRHR